MTFAEAPYGDLVETTMRVMTWNVWGRFGPWQQRERALVSVMRDTAPDLILLQESWIDDTGATQAAALGEHLGMEHCFDGGELLFGTWGLGNAIMSRWPIRDHRLHRLPIVEGAGWGGIALRAIVDGTDGPILVYCVALDWPPHASLARQYALRHLAAAIDDDLRSTKAPLVVGGDFNAGPDSDEIRMLTGQRETAVPGFVLFDAWDRARGVSGSGTTWARSNPWAAPSLLPDRRIDYIFTGWPRRGGVGDVTTVALAGVEAVDGIVPSDHYAVIADVRYGPRA